MGVLIFERQTKDCKTDLVLLLKFCMQDGDSDETRQASDNHRVINFGVRAELEGPITRPLVYGEKYFQAVPEEDWREILKISMLKV